MNYHDRLEALEKKLEPEQQGGVVIHSMDGDTEVINVNGKEYRGDAIQQWLDDSENRTGVFIHLPDNGR